MKIAVSAATAVLLGTCSVTTAFAPAAPTAFHRTSLAIGNDPNVFTDGNTWQPDSDKQMRSTDTPDFYPEDYDPNAAPGFTDGMMGSQALLGDKSSGVELPGLENVGEDAVMMGGIEVDPNIPEGMEFIPSSVPDQEFTFNVAASSSGESLTVAVEPICMTFEDFYAKFSNDSHAAFSVSPSSGRMDRRGGEPSELVVRVEPNGQAGTLEGNLVINLPEDNSKICYKFTVKSF